MLRNYFKTALRHLLKNKLYSGINTIGLAIGITCTLLAVLYWKDEFSFDQFHKNNPNIYRIAISRLNEKGDRSIGASTGHVQGPAFKAAVPEIQAATRVLGDLGVILVHEEKTFAVQPVFADSAFFDVFTFSFLRGNPASALKTINSVVITETTAKKFFNSIDVVGKLFTQEADPSYQKLSKPLVVTAVVKDPPGNSSLQFDAVMSFSYLELSFQNDNWFGGWLSSFVLLRPGANTEKVIEKFNAIHDSYAKHQVNNIEYNWSGFDPKIRYGLQPMTDVHFNTYLSAGGGNGGVSNSGSPLYSYAFMGIALFILLMAAINFINISIAGSLKRAKEVGVRKISGGNSRQIIFQFLIESAMLCFLSFVIAIILMGILLPLFNSVTGKQFILSDISDTKLLMYFVGLLVVVVLLTGLYPALILSRFEAARVLYNRQKLSGRNLFGRGLVVVQFTLAVFLVAATIAYYSQMNFVRTKDLGYNPSHIITTEVYGDRGDYTPILNYLKHGLQQEASIKALSFGNHGGFEKMKINGRSFEASKKAIDQNYLSVMEIPLLSGRNLSASDSAGKNEAIVNEAFVRAAGLQDPIGQQILIDLGYDSAYKRIVGVFKDYHFSSLREPIKPMILNLPEHAGEKHVVWVKFEKTNQQKSMAAVERVYKSAMPQALYRYQFVDEKNAREYTQELRWQKLINAASLLAFILCSLGLFGLAHLSTHQRVKEIGVRKVLGASVGQIVSLFTASFLKLVVIAIVIALPVSWMVIDKWLQNFAYRIDTSWWIFALAALAAVVIAIVTVSIQAIKATVSNPVKNLRTE
jgi:putative ABC transport system permease protein